MSSVSMINLPNLIYPYSSGVNDITNYVPSLPNGSSKTWVGWI